MAGVPARDRFELVSHLATGGMAELFLARRRDADPAEPCVVLKRILPEHARNPGFVAMFLDEARLAARLTHPNIAALLDVGRTGATYFYTLEYVHGQNLRDVLQTAARAGVAIPPGVAVAIVCGAAAGLHAAHEQRGRDGRPLEIVHRDVSPSNVMVAYDGTIKVVDFGVAKAADRMTETRSGTVKGKIAYLSPEQALLRDLDRTSDVFSLGIVAWELATQRRLFKRPSDYETMRAIIDEPIPRADDVAPMVSAALADVIAGALARGLDRRYPSAAAFAAALAAVADRAGWARDAAAVAATMRALFGAPPLPWLEPEREVTDTGVIPLTAIDVIELLDDDAPPADAPAVTARIVAPRAAPAPAGPASARAEADAASVVAAPVVAAPVVAVAAPVDAVPAPSAAMVVDASVVGAIAAPPREPDRDGTASVATAWSVPSSVPPPARRGRGWPIVLVAGALAAGVAAAVAIGAGGGAPPPGPPAALAATPGPEAVAVEDAAVAAAIAIDAGLPSDDVAAAVAPAAPARVALAPAAAAAAPLTPAQAITAAIDRRDWRAAARLCAPLITAATAADVLARCGRAFCRARRGGDARRVIALVAQREQESITRACLATGAFHEECDDPMACP